MKNNIEWPSVSIIIPTLNAASVLEECLVSIDIQEYPKDKLELIVSDGGSTDDTRELATKYKAHIVENKLKTGEAGKAAGVLAAKGEYLAFIDSDNILPTQTWLQEMISPLLLHPNAVGSEPIRYTWRRQDGFITRYCALLGMNDPFVYYLGNYDRECMLTNTWTEVAHTETEYLNYVVARFSKQLPTIGANGTVFRAAYLKEHMQVDYMFDIDILANDLKQNGSLDFIKVKNGIIHTFCESDISKFVRKQRRRVKDYLYHNLYLKDRSFDWAEAPTDSQTGLLYQALKNNFGMFIFVFSCVTFFPLLAEALRGFIKKPDLAWFFHVIACEITLWEYTKGFFGYFFSKGEASRHAWRQ